MPLVEETINRISGATWISKIDLQSAFFSLPLAMSARDKTAFMRACTDCASPLYLWD
jgi:hypothetical protein